MDDKIDVQRAIMYAKDGLVTDGANHKQWYLERILEELGVDLAVLVCDGLEWDEGVAP